MTWISCSAPEQKKYVFSVKNLSFELTVSQTHIHQEAEPFKVIVYYWSLRSTVWGQCGGKTTDPYALVCEKLW